MIKSTNIIILIRTNIAEANSVCQFYSHSCSEDTARACVFCEEMVVMQELGPLEKPSPQDMASRVVELFTKMEEHGDIGDKEDRIMEEEEELGRQLGVGRLEPVFLDYLNS